MTNKLQNGVFLLLAFALQFDAAQASIQGPDYPAPGGNLFSSSGSGLTGTGTRVYSSFDASAFDSLYFGLNQVEFGPNGAGLNGTPNPFSFLSASGTTATWQASTTWLNSVTLAPVAATTRLVLTVTGLGPNPWITNLASLGLNDTSSFGTLGAVVDNSNGLNFTLNWKVEANVGSGWQPINAIPQHISQTGKTQTNFSTAFYYEEPAVGAPEGSVPELSGIATWNMLTVAAMFAARRRAAVL